METGFRLVYSTIKTSKKKLNDQLVRNEKITRSNASFFYKNPVIELVSLVKIGFRTYTIVWKASGEVIREVRKVREVTLKKKPDPKPCNCDCWKVRKVDIHYGIMD